MQVNSFGNGLSILTRTMLDGENLYSIAYQTAFGVLDIESLGADNFDEALENFKEYSIELIEEYREVIDAAKCMYNYLDEPTDQTATQKLDRIAQQLSKIKYEIFYSHSSQKNFDPAPSLRIFSLLAGGLEYEYDDMEDRHTFIVSRIRQPDCDIKLDNPAEYLGAITAFCTTELFKIYENTGSTHLSQYADKKLGQDLGL